jgi:DNA recombination protein RmuC
MEILFLIIGLIIGFIIAWLVLKSKYASIISPAETEELNSRINQLEYEKVRSEERENGLKESYQSTYEELKKERNRVTDLLSSLSRIEENNKNLKEKLTEQKGEIEELQEKFTKEFENLANKIFEEKGNKFTEQNKERLNEILNPLKEKISDFEKKVEESNKESIRGHASLKEQLQMLKDLNQQVTQEAKNLTEALKGQSKTQGNWGEFILESLLEKSGLVKGREYSIQESITSESGKRFQPDVIVKLPEDKSLVIDSKVSLVAYEKFVSSDTEEEKQLALREHINSIRSHIKNLSGKNYQNLYRLESLDFVLMFMPIEPAFALAVQRDASLFSEAFEMNIVIVSPSTLLATLRTIASIWRQENQNKNALEIARQSGALYDKFVGFVEDLVNIGKKIDDSKSSYVDAMKKLTDGSGNLVRRVEKIRQLGAKTSKSLPKPLLDRADGEDDIPRLDE